MTNAPCQVCNVEAAVVVILDTEAGVTQEVCNHCRHDLERTVAIRVIGLVANNRGIGR